VEPMALHRREALRCAAELVEREMSQGATLAEQAFPCMVVHHLLADRASCLAGPQEPEESP
jgi:hypothetical protein